MSTGAKYANIASSAITGQILNHYIIKGGHSKPNKQEILKQVIKSMVLATPSLKINEAAAKSALKNYDDDGNLIDKKRENKFFTPEEIAVRSANTAYKAAPFVSAVTKIKMHQTKKYRAEGEARVKAWGNNVLPTEVSKWKTVVDFGDGTSIVEDVSRK